MICLRRFENLRDDGNLEENWEAREKFRFVHFVEVSSNVESSLE